MESLQQFNSTILDLAEQLSIVCPNSIISNNAGNFKMIVSACPKKIIELFIIYVLPDKDKIDKGDNDYFLNKTYDDVAKENSVSLQKFFEFKGIWKELSAENQKLVIQYMQCLCYYSQDYFITNY
jgi:hypothetical protein